jgi:hypothetical protein
MIYFPLQTPQASISLNRFPEKVKQDECVKLEKNTSRQIPVKASDTRRPIPDD